MTHCCRVRRANGTPLNPRSIRFSCSPRCHRMAARTGASIGGARDGTPKWIQYLSVCAMFFSIYSDVFCKRPNGPTPGQPRAITAPLGTKDAQHSPQPPVAVPAQPKTNNFEPWHLQPAIPWIPAVAINPTPTKTHWPERVDDKRGSKRQAGASCKQCTNPRFNRLRSRDVHV